MVKTTIILDNQLYRELVNEAVREYGSTRKLSMLINKKLRQAGAIARKPSNKRIMIKLGRKLSEKELETAIEKGWNEGVKWSA